jgi:hypothetical protein
LPISPIPVVKTEGGGQPFSTPQRVVVLQGKEHVTPPSITGSAFCTSNRLHTSAVFDLRDACFTKRIALFYRHGPYLISIMELIMPSRTAGEQVTSTMIEANVGENFALVIAGEYEYGI